MTFQERYQHNPKTDLIGKGGFARVYKAKDILLDREVAIKVFYVSDKGHYTVIEEIKKAIRLQHYNLLRYYDAAVLDTTNALGETDILQIGVMEYANAGDLKQFVRRHPGSPQFFKLLQQVLSGLEYLHQKGIIHRDLKPQNILLVEENGELTAKISDFGISKIIDTGTNSSSMAIGTIEYMAPEQFSPNRYGINGRVGTNADLWSFGIMVHELLTNQPLFGQRSGNVTAEQIMSAILSSELPQDLESLPEPYRAVVKKCLVRDARERVQKAKEISRLLDQSAEALGSYIQAGDTATSIYRKPLAPEADENTETSVLPVRKEKILATDTPPAVITAAETPRAKKTKQLMPVIILSLLIFLAVAYFLGRNIASGGKEETAQPKIAAEAELLLQKKEYVNAVALIEPWVNEYKGMAKTSQDTAEYFKVLPFYTEALFMLGDTAKAIPYLYEGKEKDVNCQYQLGSLYYSGRIIKQDYGIAKELFNEAASSGDTRAETMLGNIYFMGLGVPVDYDKAVGYYINAANNGNSVAKYALGMAYRSGNGISRDETQAIKWFQEVVEQNDNPEAENAARMQLEEMGVHKQ